MSERPTGLDSGLQRLLDEGYEVAVRQQHLLVHSIPYVASDRTIKRAVMICTFIENAGAVLPPDVSVRRTRLELGRLGDNDPVQLTNSWTRWERRTVASAGATGRS